MIVDGPFAETKEHFGGFYIVEATDLDEALALAAEVPIRPARSRFARWCPRSVPDNSEAVTRRRVRRVGMCSLFSRTALGSTLPMMRCRMRWSKH